MRCQKRLLRFLLLALCLLALAPTVRAWGDDTKLPVDQPADFSNIVGKYQLKEVSASPTDVYLDQTIRLKVVIAGSGPEKYLPQQGKLHLFRPDLEKNFYVEPLLKEQRHNAAAGTWAFYYALKPRGPQADRISSLKLTYYDPHKQLFQSSYSRAIPLQVKQRPKVIVAPERMYEVATGSTVLRPANQDVPWGLVVLGLLAAPTGCLVGYGVWHHLHPSAAIQARRRRSRAARQAVHALGQLRDDPLGEQAAGLMVRYLQQRFSVTRLATTAEEVQRTLLQVGLPAELAHQTAAFFQVFADARFAPPEVPRERSLRSEAVALIEVLERGTC